MRYGKKLLVYASRAINVLITVIFRVFFDDDNKMTHFFVDAKVPKVQTAQNWQNCKKRQNDENLALFAIYQF